MKIYGDAHGNLPLSGLNVYSARNNGADVQKVLLSTR
jgi:hypothetical protein